MKKPDEFTVFGFIVGLLWLAAVITNGVQGDQPVDSLPYSEPPQLTA